MNRYEAGFSRVVATPQMKQRFYDRLNAELLSPTPAAQAPVLTRSRKALLILIAAVLLLLSACAAYAVYWSSTQQAREYAQSEQAVDDRQALAERIADEAIAGTTFYSPITGTGEADGVSLKWKGVSYWANDDPPEFHVAFDASDTKAGDDSRLTDFEYVLSVDGKAYSAYASADDLARKLPAVARADSEALGAQYEIWFRIDDQPIVPDMPMQLTCTLYEWDVNGQRGENLGSFSIDFVYTIPTEQIEARREQLVEEALASLDEDAKKKEEALSGMPNEATPLNIVQGVFTLTDAAASKDGVLLGTIGECNWENKGVNTYYNMYLDGYHTIGKQLSAVYEPHTEEGENSSGDYPSKLTALKLLPWYAAEANQPEAVLVAVLGEGGVKNYSAGDGTPYTIEMERIQIAFYINPRTGEITLPKDDAERESWCEETRRLAADGRNEKAHCSLQSSQTIGDVSLTLTRLGFDPAQRELYVRYMIDGLYCPPEASSTVKHIYLDGTELEGWYKPGEYSASAAKLWVESYGTFTTFDNWESSTSGNSMLFVPKYLPETFEIRLVWDIYDRDKEYNRVFVGTFDITATVHKADIVPGGLWDN
jgi:hypothetical protein